MGLVFQNKGFHANKPNQFKEVQKELVEINEQLMDLPNPVT